jgi:hypothetical protein
MCVAHAFLVIKAVGQTRRRLSMRPGMSFTHWRSRTQCILTSTGALRQQGIFGALPPVVLQSQTRPRGKLSVSVIEIRTESQTKSLVNRNLRTSSTNALLRLEMAAAYTPSVRTRAIMDTCESVQALSAGAL